MFAAGDAIAFESTSADDLDFGLFRAGEQVGGLVCSPQMRTVDLIVGTRRWPLRGYARGWHVAAFDDHGRIVATYAERWLLAGRATTLDDGFDGGDAADGDLG